MVVGMPERPTNWFEERVIRQFEELSKGQARITKDQEDMAASQKEMHAKNEKKIDAIAADVAKINLELPTLRISKQVVFAFVAMILIAVVGALVALVVTKH